MTHSPTSPHSTDAATTAAIDIDQTSQDFQSSVEERKQSVHSFRVLDSQKDTESDKDLIIHSLHESLHIHKEILERIQNEKEKYQSQVEQERQEEKKSLESWRQASQQVLEEQHDRCQELEQNIALLKQELEAKKEAYQKLEVNFYSYVKQIRVTDDDLSTIQPEISHLLSQLNNTCMGLKSKMDRQGGTDFVFEHWPDKVDAIKKYMMPTSDGLLDTSYITLFVEKYLINTLLIHVLDVPIHLGVSINDAFQELDDWMASRNKEWSHRLRQQVCALVVQQPADEEAQIQAAKDQLLQDIVSVLGSVYPALKQDPKKIENLIQRASKLNLAVKGQEIKIERLPVEEGVTQFNGETMKATAKGKPNGIVFLVITPTFVARDELDNEHGFTVPGKVFCVEQEQEEEDPEVDSAVVPALDVPEDIHDQQDQDMDQEPSKKQKFSSNQEPEAEATSDTEKTEIS
ncbi:Transmembrane nucleoporin [Mucor velutinosus]|uniref:Transmembrane nucleoporin n=1 Tax=Mucor velutinosus TaxID=708070 RepID=A0AAN7DFJ5_9FUNG|nr:Transmembrane nucleoporin [Mucor velutinosus]